MIRALIVDDEAPARSKLRRLLEAEGDVEVVAEASDGAEAVKAIRGQPPDVVFLDIQMPKLDGFGVVEAVGVDAMPTVVFVTAFDEHALRAFEVQALDYLLKPFAARRFRAVLARVRKRLEAPQAEDLTQRLAALLEAGSSPEPRYPSRFLASKGADREVFVAVEDLLFVRAKGNYVSLHTAQGVHQRRDTLKSIEERLDPDRFLRINRSEIVNLSAISELQSWFHGDYRVLLGDGTSLSWSRRYRARYKGDLE